MWEKSCLHLPPPWSHVCGLRLLLVSKRCHKWLNPGKCRNTAKRIWNSPFSVFQLPQHNSAEGCLCWNVPAVPDVNRPCPSPGVITQWSLYQIFCLVRLMSLDYLKLQSSCRKAGFAWWCIQISSIICLNRSEGLESLPCLFPFSEAFQILLSSSYAHKTQTRNNTNKWKGVHFYMQLHVLYMRWFLPNKILNRGSLPNSTVYWNVFWNQKGNYKFLTSHQCGYINSGKV